MPKFNTAFTCMGRGGHCTTGVALERDIDQHMDAEGEIAREQVRGETGPMVRWHPPERLACREV